MGGGIYEDSAVRSGSAAHLTIDFYIFTVIML